VLSAISESAQTPFTFVEKLDTIKEAFAGAVSGLMSVVAQGIELRIVPEGGCVLAALHTHFTCRREAGQDGPATVLIPDAFTGERRDIVVSSACQRPLQVLRTTERQSFGHLRGTAPSMKGPLYRHRKCPWRQSALWSQRGSPM